MHTRHFSKSEAIRTGWNILKANFGFVITVGLTAIIINLLPTLVQKQLAGSRPFLSFIVAFSSIVLQTVTSIGIATISLKLVDTGNADFSDLVEGIGLFFRAIVASIAYALIVIVGCVLLIVPGVIWALKYQFYLYAIVDRDMGALEALSFSGSITRGSKANLFLFWIVLAGFNLLGLCALGIGLFVTIPVSGLATARVYRKLAAVRETGHGSATMDTKPATADPAISDGAGI